MRESCGHWVERNICIRVKAECIVVARSPLVNRARRELAFRGISALTTKSREEERTTSILVARTDLVVGIDKVIEIDKYSCIRMALRVTAWLKRFCFNVAKKTRSERKHGPLSLQELTEAEIDWIKAAQRQFVSRELQAAF